jgi:hypothetical protein
MLTNVSRIFGKIRDARNDISFLVVGISVAMEQGISLRESIGFVVANGQFPTILTFDIFLLVKYQRLKLGNSC